MPTRPYFSKFEKLLGYANKPLVLANLEVAQWQKNHENLQDFALSGQKKPYFGVFGEPKKVKNHRNPQNRKKTSILAQKHKKIARNPLETRQNSAPKPYTPSISPHSSNRVGLPKSQIGFLGAWTGPGKRPKRPCWGGGFAQKTKLHFWILPPLPKPPPPPKGQKANLEGWRGLVFG